MAEAAEGLLLGPPVHPLATWFQNEILPSIVRIRMASWAISIRCACRFNSSCDSRQLDGSLAHALFHDSCARLSSSSASLRTVMSTAVPMIRLA